MLVIVYCYNCLHSRHFTDVTSAKEQLYWKTDTACHSRREIRENWPKSHVRMILHDFCFRGFGIPPAIISLSSDDIYQRWHRLFFIFCLALQNFLFLSRGRITYCEIDFVRSAARKLQACRWIGRLFFFKDSLFLHSQLLVLYTELDGLPLLFLSMCCI